MTVPSAKLTRRPSLRRPVPYECDITPRFTEAAALLGHELELRGL
jgi:hypothetical protein